MSSPLGGALPPPVYDPYAVRASSLSESIHTQLTEREGNMFDSALATYHRRRSVKPFVETLALVLNTNAKRQLLIPIRDAYIKASDVTRFNELAVSHGLAATLTNRRKKKTKVGPREGSPAHQEAVTIYIKKSAKGEAGFSVRGDSESGTGVFVAWVDSGSSADKSGLQVGDQILSVNETSFESISHYDAAKVINESKNLSLQVLPNAKVTSSRTANMTFTWVDAEGRHTSPPMPEERHNERTARLQLTKGRDLGISIRGGAEYGLGIYISVVEEGSVAWEEGLKKGDQILDINGHSFRNIRHADAVKVLRSNHTLVLKLKDIGKLPYTKILPYNDKKWHHSQGSTFPRAAQRQNSESPRQNSENSESPFLLRKQEGRVSPVRDVIESLAVSVLSHPEFTQFKKLVYQYEHQELPVEDFAKELLRLLDRPEKLRLLSEVKAIITPDDLNSFNELTIRKELQAKKAMKANGAVSYAEVVSHTLPKQSNKGSKAYKYQLHVGEDDDDDNNDDDNTGPFDGYMSEDLDERSSSRAMRATGSLDDIPQRLSPSGIPPFLKPPPPPLQPASSHAHEDNPMSTQWSESSLQSGFSRDTNHEPGEVPTLKGIRRWTEDGEAPRAADIEAKVRSETEMKLRKEFEEKERIKSEELRKQLLEEQRKKEDAIKAEKEALQKRIREVEENAKREAEEKLRKQLEERERELIAKAQQEQQEKLQAERKAAEQRVKEAEERAKRELEQKVLKEAEERLKAEYEKRMVQEAAKLKETVAKSGEVEKKVRQELEAKLQREYEQKLEQELKKRAKQEEEEKKSRQQEVLVNKNDEVARLEAEEEARMAMEERIRREAEAKVRAEYEARLQRETQEKVRLAEEIKVHKAAEARLQKDHETGDQGRNAGLDVLKKPTEKKPKVEGIVVEPLRKQASIGSTIKKPKPEEVTEPLREKRPDENEELAMQVKAAEDDQKLREQADAAEQKKEAEETRKKAEEKQRKEELQRKREENLQKREQERKAAAAQQEGNKLQPQLTKRVADAGAGAQVEQGKLKTEAPSLKGEPASDQELIKRQKADKERAEQREKAERERAEQRQKAEREAAEQREKAEREQADRKKAERETAEREKAEREKAEREKAEREKAEREKAERERAEQRQKAEREAAEQREKAEREQADREKAEQQKAAQERERARQEELKLQNERAEAVRKQKELQKLEEAKIAEQKRQAAEERKKAEDARKAAFNVVHEPVNFGEDVSAIKTKQQLIDEDRLMAEERLKKKLQEKAAKQQSSEGPGGVQMREKVTKQQSSEGPGGVQMREKVTKQQSSEGPGGVQMREKVTKQQSSEGPGGVQLREKVTKQQSSEGPGGVQMREKVTKQQSSEGPGGVQMREKVQPAPSAPNVDPTPKLQQTPKAEPAPKVQPIPQVLPAPNAESIPKADPLEEADFAGPTTGGFSYAGYDNLHGRLDTIKVIKFTKKLGIAIDGGSNTKQKAVLIREIMHDGCASSTNLRVGHQILQVNGHSVYGMKHRDVVMNIKDAFEGPLNKTIEFVVLEREPSEAAPEPPKSLQ